MSILVKIAVIAVAFSCLAVMLKNQRPEYVFLLRIGAIVIVFSLVVDEIAVAISNIISAFSVFNIDSAHISLLLKVVGITVITDFICDILKDSGESSIAGIVSVTARLVILVMCLPLINALILFSLKMLE